MAIEVVEYSEEYKPELAIFCYRCKELGWTLNQSFDAMKLNDNKFWLIFVDNVIACTSGVQQLSFYDSSSTIKDDDYRLYFRTAVLPEYYHYYPYNRYMGNSLYIRHLTELQVKWAKDQGANRLVITGTTTNAGSPEMAKIVRITRLNEVKNCKKRGIPPLWDELGTCTLFYTEQVVFQLIEDNLKWWANKWIS